MIKLAWLITLAASLYVSSGKLNLVQDPGFDSPWMAYNDETAKPRYSTVQAGRTGKCACISLGKQGRAIYLSKPIPAAPGERFTASVWYRGHDIKTQNGGVVLAGACQNELGKYFKWFRFFSKQADGQWRKLSGDFETPEGTARIILQIGLNTASGTVFFDDAEVVTENPYAVRLKLGEEYEPEKGKVDLALINRKKTRDQVKLKLTIGKSVSETEVRLSGEDEQLDSIQINPERGRAEASATLESIDHNVLVKSYPNRINVLGGLELEPLVPTHFCIEDGKPSLGGRLWFHAKDAELTGATLRAVLLDKDGSEIASRNWSLVKSGRLDFTLDAPGADVGDYTVVTEMRTRDGKLESDRQDWHVIHRDQARVTIDANGYPVSAGKVIFPLGTYNSGRYDLMKKTGFTVVHAWNRARTGEGERPRHQPTKDFLDDAEKAGLKAVLMAPSTLAQKGDWEEVTRRVRMFRNHPALLAWDEEEGVARGEMDKKLLDRLIDTVRREDQNHPFCLADSSEVITKVDRKRFFQDLKVEIGMWWWYPIPLDGSTETALLDGQDPASGNSLEPPSFLASEKSGKPLWVGLQAYRKPKQSNGRLPTPQEHRAMAYLAAISGGKGFFYYMGGSAAVVEGEKDQGRPWGYLNDLVPELSQMIPSFIAPLSSDQVRVQPQDAPVSVSTREAEGLRVIIAVNRSDKPLDIRLSIADPVNVLFENREVSPAEGMVPDHFEPYGVHVYKVVK